MAEGTTRVEAFSDGVFAIAITLLVIEIPASTVLALVQPVVGLALNVSLWILWIRLCYRSTHLAADALDAAGDSR